MNFEIRKQRIPLWWIVIAILILTLFITVFFNSNAPMDSYVDDNTEEIIDNGVVKKELDETFKVYEDTETGLSLEIPDTWQEIVKDGGKSFIHAASGTTLSIQILDYDPLINRHDAEYMKTTYLNENDAVQMIAFNNLSSTTTQMIYTKTYEDGIYDYITNFMWDRKKIITISTTLKDEDYESFKDILE